MADPNMDHEMSIDAAIARLELAIADLARRELTDEECVALMPVELKLVSLCGPKPEPEPSQE